MNLHKGLGWKPDKPDFRDKKYVEIKPKYKTSTLPPVVDLRPDMPPILDQGDLGSCTAHCIASALMYNRKKEKETPDFIPSRLFIYYNERAAEGTINEDAGAEIRNGIKCVTKLGFCDEKFLPYDQSKFKKRPTAAAYKNAALYKAVEYFRLNNSNINELKTCLYSGFPFVFGFSVFNTIDASEKTGVVPMPTTRDSMDGGHAVLCCGYNDEKKWFIIHNSWGTDVGDKGYYYLPYDYVINPELSDDFWTIRKIEEKDGI